MGICSICKKAIDSAQPDHIPIGSAEKPICPACKAQLNLLLHSNRLIELRGAIRYLTACGETTADPDVASALRALCEKNAERLQGAADALPYEPVAQQEPPSIWINIVKAASWSLLVLIILGGLFGALAIFNTEIWKEAACWRSSRLSLPSSSAYSRWPGSWCMQTMRRIPGNPQAIG